MWLNDSEGGGRDVSSHCDRFRDRKGSERFLRLFAIRDRESEAAGNQVARRLRAARIGDATHSALRRRLRSANARSDTSASGAMSSKACGQPGRTITSVLIESRKSRRP